ncbi:MAG: Rrf2 family transcriptional regulator [Gemmatimonadales bacterium]
MLSLPQTAEYALRAVNFIADTPDGRPRRVAEISAAIKVPSNYLSKTLHQLALAGVLRSTRGPAGGFQLAIPAERLTLAEVITPFLPVTGRPCVLGRARCNDTTPCAAHHLWKPVGQQLEAFFAATTIAELGR